MQSRSKRTSRNTLAELEAMADENGIGEMFRQVREGVRDDLLARPYYKRIWYAVRLDSGRQRTLLIVNSAKDEDTLGLPFTVHASRFSEHMGISMEQLRAWLPETTLEAPVNHWSGSSPEERANALGLAGSFQRRGGGGEVPGWTQEQGADPRIALGLHPARANIRPTNPRTISALGFRSSVSMKP